YKAFAGLCVLITGFAGGCSHDYDFPLEPVLSYKDFVLEKNQDGLLTQGILMLEFTDGDGDIGLSQGDTLPPYHLGGDNYYNFFIDLYYKSGTGYEKVTFPDTSYTFNSRIPRIELNGKSKAIRGVIEYTFDLQLMLPFLQSDTLQVRTSITDRALHRSNLVTSPDIAIVP
ncbi:MAG TPA: hypothetical protein P5338_08980, partial [Bacteroidales bacterium]|nr:hypothetical protein [Bacteroidales bacterium]